MTLNTRISNDEMHHECGVFGVHGCKDAARLCYLGLYSLQHRGQESAGIVSLDKSKFYVAKGMGLVSEVFDEDNLKYCRGSQAMGHVRYSTTGSSNPNNIQPLYSKTSKGKVAIGHNGNITNALTLFNKLRKAGSLFQSTVDSEVILHLLSRDHARDFLKNLQNTLAQIEGAYSLVMLTEHGLIAARDPHGFRPLVLGRLNHGYVIASETCAFDLIGATYIREIERGEIVCITDEGIKSVFVPKQLKPGLCIFEHVYFARPDTVLFGDSVYEVRKELGRVLAREHPVEADLVMAIPDSGNSAALGYAEESGIPFELGMTRNHYVGRTFIQPSQKVRDFAVRVKLNPVRSVIEGKRVIVVDDSIVRGTTSKHRVSAIRDAGAKAVHVRISSPPITYPCHFGIDTPNRDKLIGAQKTVDEICKYIGADSLAFISKEGMLSAVQSQAPDQFCVGCFTGKYPARVRNKGKFALESRSIKLYGKEKRS